MTELCSIKDDVFYNHCKKYIQLLYNINITNINSKIEITSQFIFDYLRHYNLTDETIKAWTDVLIYSFRNKSKLKIQFKHDIIVFGD